MAKKIMGWMVSEKKVLDVRCMSVEQRIEVVHSKNVCRAIVNGYM